MEQLNTLKASDFSLRGFPEKVALILTFNVSGFLEHVTVLIGIAVGTKAVAGVIHQPYYRQQTEKFGRTIWGILGLGTYGYTPQQLPTNRLIVATTRSHSNVLVQEAVNSLKADEVLRVSGAGNKVRNT